VTLFVTVVFAADAFTSGDTIHQISNLKGALQKVRATRQHPVLVAVPNRHLQITDEPIPDEVKVIFNEIQRFVFGGESLIKLQNCHGCEAIADAHTMSVSVDPKFLQKLNSMYGRASKNIIKFVLAHEISHFTYEYSVLSSNDKLSPNGHISLLTISFPDLVDLDYYRAMRPQDQDAEIKKYREMTVPGHSEVDLLGLLTLKEMGFEASADVIKYLQREIAARTPEELAETDFELRLKNIKEAVASGAL